VLLLIPSGIRELGHRLTKTVGNTRVDLITLVQILIRVLSAADTVNAD
jgi:hypothetical protein